MSIGGGGSGGGTQTTVASTQPYGPAEPALGQILSEAQTIYGQGPAAADTTVVIKSIRVTNNTSNTPTISLDVSDNSASAEYTILRTQTLAANTGVELLSVPLVLEESDALKATISSSDSIHFGISYLVIT